jgi:hypothetical protein
MKGVAWKVVGFVALVAATLSGPLTSVSGGILAFGVLNLFLEVPGTGKLRIVAVVASVVALLVPRYSSFAIAALIWLIWPPVFLMAWSRDRHASRERQSATAATAAEDSARVATASMVIAVAIGSLVYRALVLGRLEQTAALFVGIPAILAIAVIYTVSPQSATGVACKAVTLGLLVSILLLWEGFVCVALSAPIFYFVAVALTWVPHQLRGDNHNGPGAGTKGMIALLILPLSLEGVTPSMSFSRHEEVVESRIVNAPAASVADAILQPPRFDRPLPLPLRIGFPRPIAAEVNTTVNGRRRWVIQMRGGEMLLNGMEPRTGDLVLEMVESSPGTIRWRAVSDNSHMTHFLRWQEAEMRIDAVDASTTRITCILRYERALDPAWYFGPMERYATTLAAGYLVDAVAKP